MRSKNRNTTLFCYKCLKNFLPAEEKQHGLHPLCFQEWFQIPTVMDFQNLSLKAQDNESHDPLQDLEQQIVNSSFFQGKFKKYSASLNNEEYILKVQELEYPELPATEYLCNQMATLLKIQVPEYHLIQFQNTMNTFVVKNFMHEIQGGNLIHIYHYLKTPSDYNCQTLLNIIIEKTNQRKNVVHFIEMCLFDALIGNNDRHGRNFGLIQTRQGLTLAPIYDNPSYLAIEEDWLLEANHEPKGKISTQTTDNPSMKDYIIEFKRLGFEDVIVHFKKLVNIEKLFFIIDNAYISQKRKEAFKRLMRKRHQEMLNE